MLHFSFIWSFSGEFLSLSICLKEASILICQTVPAPVFQRGLFVCEPAISVKRRGYPNQIWSLEKLDNKLVDMRELYNEIQSGNIMQVRGTEWRKLEPSGKLSGNLNRNSWAYYA